MNKRTTDWATDPPMNEQTVELNNERTDGQANRGKEQMSERAKKRIMGRTSKGE